MKVVVLKDRLYRNLNNEYDKKIFLHKGIYSVVREISSLGYLIKIGETRQDKRLTVVRYNQAEEM